MVSTCAAVIERLPVRLNHGNPTAPSPVTAAYNRRSACIRLPSLTLHKHKWFTSNTCISTMRCGPAQALQDEANYGAFAHIEGFQTRLLGKQLQSFEGLLANLQSTLCAPS